MTFDDIVCLSTDYNGSRAGGTGKEAEAGIQGGAAHFGDVPRELRVSSTEREREREGTTVSTGPSKRIPRYLPLTVGAGTANQTWDLCFFLFTSMMAPATGPNTEAEPLLLTALGRNRSREDNNMACTVVLFAFVCLFFLKGNSLTVWQEIVCCACVPGCTWARVHVVLKTANGETDLSSTQSVTHFWLWDTRADVALDSLHSDLSDFIYFCTCTFEYYQLPLKRLPKIPTGFRGCEECIATSGWCVGSETGHGPCLLSRLPSVDWCVTRHRQNLRYVSNQTCTGTHTTQSAEPCLGSLPSSSITCT